MATCRSTVLRRRGERDDRGGRRHGQCHAGNRAHLARRVAVRRLRFAAFHDVADFHGDAVDGVLRDRDEGSGIERPAERRGIRDFVLALVETRATEIGLRADRRVGGDVDNEAADGDLVARKARRRCGAGRRVVERRRPPPHGAHLERASGTELNRHSAAIGEAHLDRKCLTRHGRRHGRRGSKWSASSTASTGRRRASRLGKGGEIQPKSGRDRVLELPLLDAEHVKRLGLTRNARDQVAREAQSFRESRHGR